MRSVEFFLPQYKTKREWSDRTIDLMLPLFPGYLFVRIASVDRTRVLEIPGVVTLVGAGGRPEALEDAEIEQLKAACDRRNDPRPHEYRDYPRYVIGERVRVAQGPMYGMEGVLMRDKGKSRVVVQLDAIHRAMSIEVDLAAIVPAGGNTHWQRQ